MKKINIFLTIPLVLLALSGCKKIVSGYDVSPNNPTDANISLLLTATEVQTFSTMSGNMVRTSGSWAQQLNGCINQTADYSNYKLYENDENNDWATIYAGALVNLEKIITKSGDTKPYYRGVARVLKAVNLGVATDFWGDIPNKEALLGLGGDANFKPKYDTQESVIADIQKLLSDAIVDLSKDVSANIGTPGENAVPGGDDLIFGGDASKWVKTAYILKARYANRLSKRNPSASAADALSALAAAGLTGTGDDAMIVFDPNYGPNQFASFENNRSGYLRANDFFVQMMKANNDPRVPYYFGLAEDSTYTGTPTGGTDITTSYIGDYFLGDAIPFVTYVEAKFIEAEAKLRSGDAAGAATAMNDAVSTHLEQVASGDPGNAAYIAANASETAASVTLEKIMTQKYIAMFCTLEPYSDWRRTAIPALTVNPNGAGTNGQIPRRFPTPLNERVNNSNAPAVQDLTQRVWWDMQ